jgi:hypothetical protein
MRMPGDRHNVEGNWELEVNAMMSKRGKSKGRIIA